MPYIEERYRKELEPEIESLANKLKSYQKDHKLWPGILNYVLTKLILKSLPELRYWTIAILTGILENIKQEFYRRVVSQYEERKKEQHGDVY